ncbi:Hypothetical protein A7982_09267 [Minicystis rosea]|nr:Hypothetical protein A7982_09267 [Minicystis rosea]
MDFSPLPFKGLAKVPPNGACCDIEGMTCGGYEDCGPVCTCEGGAWSCKPDVMCEPFACPTDVGDLQALHDTPCDGHIGQGCSIGPACGGTFCTCTLDDETAKPSWRCATTPC